jgi:heat shock protein HslJ
MNSKLSLILLLAIGTGSCHSTKPAASLNKGLTGTYWKLIELNGRPINSPAGTNGYYIMMNKDDNRVSAFAGCNQIMGEFAAPDAFRLSFSKMASTRKACPDMSLETELTNVLQSVDNYAIAENTLSLNKSRMAPLAKFVASAQPK